MKAVVTGGAGFIGSAIARALLERGDEVVIVDDLSSGSAERVPAEAQLTQIDIGDGEGLSDAFAGADVVFHQAALRSVPRSVEEPHIVHRANATGTLNVLMAAEEAGVGRVVYASSSSGYGGQAHGQMSRETDTPAPRSPYAVSKLAGEYYCRVWSEIKGLSTVALRYFNVFGPGQRSDSRYAAVFPAFITALKIGDAPEIHWDGEQSRDFTYIDDVVAANLAAAETDGEGVDGAVFNVASGSPRTINEVFHALRSVIGAQVEPRYVPRRAGDIRHSYADISHARALLGWQPESSWDASVEATVAWFGTLELNGSQAATATDR